MSYVYFLHFCCFCCLIIAIRSWHYYVCFNERTCCLPTDMLICMASRIDGQSVPFVYLLFYQRFWAEEKLHCNTILSGPDAGRTMERAIFSSLPHGSFSLQSVAEGSEIISEVEEIREVGSNDSTTFWCLSILEESLVKQFLSIFCNFEFGL